MPLPDDERPVPDRSNFEPDVEVIHRTLLREQGDPEEGREPAPWFVLAAILIGLFWGGWYLGRYGGSFGPETHVALRGAAGGAAAAPDDGEVDMLALGARAYSANCQACHQADGRGVPGNFPPIVGSEWVTGAPETVVRILLHGLIGPIEVSGATYNGNMPAWRDALTDQQIAALSTYIRQWDANDASPVETAAVEALREQHASRSAQWTADELRAAEAEEPAAPAAPAAGDSAGPVAPDNRPAPPAGEVAARRAVAASPVLPSPRSPRGGA